MRLVFTYRVGVFKDLNDLTLTLTLTNPNRFSKVSEVGFHVQGWGVQRFE